MGRVTSSSSWHDVNNLAVVSGVASVLAAWYNVYATVAGVVVVGAGVRWWYRTVRHCVTENYAVLISGCDSGLGYSLAVHAHRLGLTVLAACLDAEGPGASKLREECGAERLHIVSLDVTREESVKRSVENVRSILKEHACLELKALVNNAAVMVFGEFEWQTERQMRQQVEVNLLGTMRVTKAFTSLIRQHQGRIITVTSHCAQASLPGLGAYGATKGALKSWSDSLRVEQAKYGVPVVTFVPGSFIDKSGIMSRHRINAQEMEAAMSAEDKRFFGDYFHVYHSYLSALSDQTRPPAVIKDEQLHYMFEDALLTKHPRHNYMHGPLRYAVYHFLFKITPTWIRDWLVVKFVQMPIWTNQTL